MRKLYILALIVGYIFFMGCGNQHQDKYSNNAHDHEESNEGHSHENNVTESEHNKEPIEDVSSHGHEHQSETHSNSQEEGSHTHTSREAAQSHGESEEHNHDNQSSAANQEQTESQEGHTHEENYVVEEIKPGTFHEVVRTSGQIKSLPQNEAGLIAPVSGRIQFASNQILSGKNIKNGEPLFYISGESLAEGNLFVKLQKARAIFNQKKNDFERAEKLYKDQLISEKEYLAHQTEYLNAKSEYQNLSSHFSGESGIVKSKQKGYLKDVFVEQGDYVSTGQKIASVINTGRVMLEAEVSQKYASRMDEFVTANFITPDGNLYSTKELNGRLLSKGKAVTVESFYLPVFFEIDQKESFVPGSFVHVFLIGEEKKGVIALPEDAFIEEQGNFFVFVQQGEELVKKAVETGTSDGEYILVKSGIKTGDKVVTHGAYHVKLMKASSNMPAHGHSH